MKTVLATSLALATLVTSATLATAAPRRHVAPEAFAAANGSTVVTLGNRVVGQDPDINIRSQLQKDPVASEY